MYSHVDIEVMTFHAYVIQHLAVLQLDMSQFLSICVKAFRQACGVGALRERALPVHPKLSLAAISTVP